MHTIKSSMCLLIYLEKTDIVLVWYPVGALCRLTANILQGLAKIELVSIFAVFNINQSNGCT